MFLGFYSRIPHAENQLPTTKTVTCRVATDRQTDKQTETVKTEGPIEFVGSFFFLYFFIDERSNRYPWIYQFNCILMLWTTHVKHFGPLIDKEIKKKNDRKKSIGPSAFTHSVCLFVCLSVSALQVTVFVVGMWFLAWGILESIPKNAFFCFLKFRNLTYLWLFLAFFGVFPS